MADHLAGKSLSSWAVLALGAALATTACSSDNDATSTGTGSGATSSSGAGGSGGATSGSGGAGGSGSATSGSGGAGGSGGASGSGGAGGSGGSNGCGMPVMAGETTHTINVNGVDRTYLAVVPASLDGNTPAPVLLGFHGGSGTSQQASQNYGLTGPEAMLYVYPQAPFWPEAGGVAWNVDPAGVDFPYFDALLIDIGEKHCIDATRIFAAGQSNGGFFVNALGCYRPEALRAIAPAAGGGPPGQCDPSTVTAMIVHGTNDSTVPVSSGKFARDWWLNSNGCAGAPSAPVNPAPCVAYDGCAEPVLWCEHPGGHSWPAFAGPAIRGFFLSL